MCGSAGTILAWPEVSFGLDPQYHVNWTYWHMPIVLVFERQRQRGSEAQDFLWL